MIPENCFIFSKKEVFSLNTSKLFGYAITEDSVIMGTRGLLEYEGEKNHCGYPTEGRFCGLFVLDDKIVVRTDATGQELIYLFQKGSEWIISNSFLLLAAKAASQFKIELYQPAVLSFHLKEGVHIGEQLISHKTMISEITVLPITAELIVDRQTGELKICSKDYFSIFTLKDSVRYDECLLEFLERGAGILSAMQDQNIPMNLFLSGGYDSRLVLCMLMAGRCINNLRVTSFCEKKNDYQVAKNLSTLLNLKLNIPGPVNKSMCSSSDAVRIYLLSCGATYLPFYPVQNFKLFSDAELRLTGDQPTGWSHFAGKARFNGDAKKIGNDIMVALQERASGQAVRDDFFSTFDILQIDKNHPAAMLAYYSAIRGRFHCGRNWYKSLGNQCLFTPLMQSSFVALDLFNSEHGYHPTKLFVDAFSAFGGWALAEPFETADRAFDPSLIANSLFKGGAAITPRKFKVYGNICENFDKTEVDIFSIPVDINTDVELIKSLLATLFYRSKLARQSGLFLKEDFAKANAEIHVSSTLSHGYRKVCHIISTDIVLRLIESTI